MHVTPSQVWRSGAQARGLGSHAVQLEGQVWRPGYLRGQAAEGAGRRESQAEETPARVDARQCRAERPTQKIVGPATKREAMRVSGLYRGCADRTMIRYRSRPPADMAVPYPMGFFAKQVDGRIDGPALGWKGRAL